MSSHQLTTSSGEGVMKATMTDVQKAIEQLGQSNVAGDEDRSFSFASSRGDVTEGETDTEYDMSDVDARSSTADGETWHKGARTKLAERAKRAVEEAEKFEAMMSGSNRAAPPIEVEMSDESESEEEYARGHARIPEEAEGGVGDPRRLLELEEQQEMVAKDSLSVKTGTMAQEESTFELEQLNYESTTATATQTSFPVLHALSSSSQLEVQNPVESKSSSDSNANDRERIRESMDTRPPSILPTPAEQSKHNSTASDTSVCPSGSGLSQQVQTSSIRTTLVDDQIDVLKDAVKGVEKEKKHPSEWEVNEVVGWLKGRGFDQDVCEKFTGTPLTYF